MHNLGVAAAGVTPGGVGEGEIRYPGMAGASMVALSFRRGVVVEWGDGRRVSMRETEQKSRVLLFLCPMCLCLHRLSQAADLARKHVYSKDLSFC